MTLSDEQFKEWKQGFRPGSDIRVPKSRFVGLSGMKEDAGLEHLDDLVAPDVISDAYEYSSGYANVVDYPINNLLAQHHVDKEGARKVFDSIKAKGYDPNEPIRAIGDEYGAVIVNGHHRAVASRAAGMKNIPTELLGWSDFYRGLDQTGRT